MSLLLERELERRLIRLERGLQRKTKIVICIGTSACRGVSRGDLERLRDVVD